jgi:hypothetical protein
MSLARHLRGARDVQQGACHRGAACRAGVRGYPRPVLRRRDHGRGRSSQMEEFKFAYDSLLEGTGFEPSVPRQEKWSMPSSSDQTRVGRTLTLGGGAESSLGGRDIELSVSPKDIRTSPYDLCVNRSDRRQSREGEPMVRIHFPPAVSLQRTRFGRASVTRMVLPHRKASPERSNGLSRKMCPLRGTEGSNPSSSSGESATNRAYRGSRALECLANPLVAAT